MPSYALELARPDDDADLADLAARVGSSGAVRVAIGAGSSFLDGCAVLGRRSEVLVARDMDTRRIVGIATRSVRERWVDGERREIGYLGALRLDPAHRGGTLLARGFRLLAERDRAEGGVPYLTTIAEDNAPALAALAASRADLPAYEDLGAYVTAALAPRPAMETAGDLVLRAAREDDRAAVLELLASEGPRRQFFPCLSDEDLFRPAGTFRALEPADLALAFRRGRLVGTLGSWDQRDFRPTRVLGYEDQRAAGAAGMPAPGGVLPVRHAAVPVARDDDPEILRALLGFQLARARELLLVGMHERDPLLPVIDRLQPIARYRTRLFLVRFGRDRRPIGASRVPYLELGTL